MKRLFFALASGLFMLLSHVVMAEEKAEPKKGAYSSELEGLKQRIGTVL